MEYTIGLNWSVLDPEARSQYRAMCSSASVRRVFDRLVRESADSAHPMGAQTALELAESEIIDRPHAEWHAAHPNEQYCHRCGTYLDWAWCPTCRVYRD